MKNAKNAKITVAETRLRRMPRDREFLIENLLVRIHFIIVMIRWTGLAPSEVESFSR